MKWSELAMLAKEEILKALRSIEEPTLHRSIVDLQWLKDVMVKENRISLTIVLAALNEQDQIRIEREVRAILEKLTDTPLHFRFRQMTEMEARQAGLSQAQEDGGAATEPRSHAQGLRTNLLSPDSGTTFIAVASGKGGVGKSTVTVNLAVALARKGKKVGVIDADIYGFSVPDMMGIEDRPQMADEKTIIPVQKFGVKVMSMGFFVEDNAPIIWRGPMLGKMLRNFFNEVDWGELDYMLLDLPPGTGDVALDVHQMIPHSREIIVTTPHATAAFVAARAGAMARHTEHDILGVVENMSYYECGACGKKDYVFGRGGGSKLAEELHTDLLAQIPLGAPENHPSEADYSPSVYKADSNVGQMYVNVADTIIAKING